MIFYILVTLLNKEKKMFGSGASNNNTNRPHPRSRIPMPTRTVNDP
jgi:hypothetical protein